MQAKLGQRLKQHAEPAAKPRPACSHEVRGFYDKYPSRKHPDYAGTAAAGQVRQGWFEGPRAVAGLVFSPSGGAHRALAKGGAAPPWPAEHRDWARKVPFGGSSTGQNNMVNMAAYACELAYDLCTAPAMNVSCSPGFEAPLGAWGGGGG